MRRNGGIYILGGCHGLQRLRTWCVLWGRPLRIMGWRRTLRKVSQFLASLSIPFFALKHRDWRNCSLNFYILTWVYRYQPNWITTGSCPQDGHTSRWPPPSTRTQLQNAYATHKWHLSPSKPSCNPLPFLSKARIHFKKPRVVRRNSLTAFSYNTHSS